jgi:hypothetical protein
MTNEIPEQLPFGNHIVAFIDLLGQRKQYGGQGLMPRFTSEAEKEAFTKDVRQSLGKVLSLHSAGMSYIAGAKAERARILTDKPADLAQEFEKLNNNNLKHQRWADGFLYFANLDDDEVAVKMNAVYLVITLCGSLCQVALANASPLRAGIDIAWATEVYPNEIYGCAPVRAYELESQVAVYPRIVVGPNVVDCLRFYASREIKTKEDKICQGLAQVTSSFLSKDDDQVVIVDYLGKPFRKYFSNDTVEEQIQRSHAFARSELAKFKKAGDAKLTERYTRLVNYFDRSH